MASTYSTNLKIELPGTGDQSGTWGTTLNTNMGTALEEAIVGRATVSFATDADATLALTNSNASQAARAYILNVTSAVSLTATRNLVVPTINKPYVIENNTTGGQSITVKTSAGSGVTVPNGKKAMVYANSTNVVAAFDYATALTLGTALPVSSGGTGATTLTGIVKGNGTGAFTAATANTDYVSPTGADGLLKRWMFQDCAWDFYDSATTNALDFTNGSHQRWAPNTGAQTLSITNWPPSGNLGELLIEGVNLGAATITWPAAINWVNPDGSTTTSIATYLGSISRSLKTSGTDFIFLWTRDAGTTIYGKAI